MMSFDIEPLDFYTESRRKSRHEELFDDSEGRRFRRKSLGGKRRLSRALVISEGNVLEKFEIDESKKPKELRCNRSEDILYIGGHTPDEIRPHRYRRKSCAANGERRTRRLNDKNRKFSLPNLPIPPNELKYLINGVATANSTEENIIMNESEPERRRLLNDKAAIIAQQRSLSLSPCDFRSSTPEPSVEIAVEVVERETKTLDFALKLHECTQRIAVLTHGIMAGIAVAQCIFIFVFLGEGNTALMKYYSQVSLQCQSVYYLLLTISVVSVLDRYCGLKSNWEHFLHHLIKKPCRAVTFVSYMLALMFSVSLALLDDRISYYNDIEQLSLSPRQLSNWKILNTFRVVSALLGWLFSDVVAKGDETSLSIKKMIADEKGIGYP